MHWFIPILDFPIYRLVVAFHIFTRLLAALSVWRIKMVPGSSPCYRLTPSSCAIFSIVFMILTPFRNLMIQLYCVMYPNMNVGCFISIDCALVHTHVKCSPLTHSHSVACFHHIVGIVRAWRIKMIHHNVVVRPPCVPIMNIRISNDWLCKTLTWTCN